MGYEPLPPYRGKTLFGKETIFYPNVFRYCSLFYKMNLSISRLFDFSKIYLFYRWLYGFISWIWLFSFIENDLLVYNNES
jgi:hypothetical protein